MSKAYACRGLALVGLHQYVMLYFEGAVWCFLGKAKQEGVKINHHFKIATSYLCHSGTLCSCVFKHLSVPPFLARIVSSFSVDLGRTYNVLKKEQQDKVSRLRQEPGLSKEVFPRSAYSSSRLAITD